MRGAAPLAGLRRGARGRGCARGRTRREPRREPDHGAAGGPLRLFSLFGGRETEVLVQRLLGELINQRYSREVEAKADDAALRFLERADIDPGALADAFGRLESAGEKAPKNVLKYLESHPDLESRIARAREASREASLRHAGPWRPFDPGLWKEIRAAL